MDWIGWAGIAAAVVFGVVAWLQGRSASRGAKSAGEKAERLEQRFTALTGDVEAIKGAAVETRQLAEDANVISRGALMGVQESHDVEWQGNWEGDAYVLTNTGRDEALKVRGSVAIDELERRFDVEHVWPGDEIRLDFAEVVRKHAEEAREQRARDRGSPFPAYNPTWMSAPFVWIRVLWKSEGGVAHEYSPKAMQDDPLS